MPIPDRRLRGMLRTARAPEFSSGVKLSAAGTLLVLYSAGFYLLYPVLGTATSALFVIPVVVVGWLFGAWGGILTALLSFPLNVGLTMAVDGAAWRVFLTRESMEATGLLIGLGAIVGLLQELERSLQEKIRRLEGSERMQARTERRYRALFESSGDALLIVSEDGRVREANPAAVELFADEEKEKEIVQAPARDLFVDVEDWRAIRERLDERGSVSQSQVELRTSGGETRVALLAASTLPPTDAAESGDEGRGTETALFIHDVTERRRMEQFLQRFQRLDALGQLTGGMAHDFNNILNVVLSSAELIEPALDQEEPEAREHLEDLRGAALRGTRLVDKLLAFGRQEEIALHSVDLAAVVEGALETVRPLIPDGVTVDLDVQDSVPPILGDLGGVEQILMNLVTNSRDAMPDGGRLTIAVLETRLTEEDHATLGSWVVPGEYVCLSVRDTGVGMEPDVVERAFEPFFTTKPSEDGTGLGMAVIYGLVKRQNGFVKIHSERHLGTTVNVYLPVDPSGSPSVADNTSTAGDPGLPGGQETLLLVEDDEALRRATGATLQRLGYRVHVASDGQEALEILDSRDGGGVDLVLSDLWMPRMGGAELYRRIRERKESPRFVLMSGSQEPPEPLRTDLGPAGGIIKKPWTMDLLARRIRGVLEG